MKIMHFADYIDQLHEEFPLVSVKSIKAIVRHGLYMLARFRRSYYDVYLNHAGIDTYFYFGEITATPALRYEQYKKQIRRKLRVISIVKKVPYTGYYYFGLSEEDYIKYYVNNTAHDSLTVYKLEEEARLYKLATHWFRVPMKEEWWAKKLLNYETSSAEHIQ